MNKPSRVIAELRNAAKEAWPPTVRFLQWARKKEPTPEYTTTEDLAASLEIKPSEAKELFSGIEKLHLAEFIVGRRKSPSRLVWQFQLPSIAAVADGKTDDLIPVSRPGLAPARHIDLIEHPFQLRRDCKIALSLPSDLTKDEAARLAAFVQTLPFDD